MIETEFDELEMATITHPLRVMHRMSEVQRINDGPFFLDLKIVVV